MKAFCILFFAGLQYDTNIILTVQKLGFVLAIMELAPVCNCVNLVRARVVITMNIIDCP